MLVWAIRLCFLLGFEPMLALCGLGRAGFADASFLGEILVEVRVARVARVAPGPCCLL